MNRRIISAITPEPNKLALVAMLCSTSPPPTPEESIPISEEEVSEAEMPWDEGDIGGLEESPISFKLSGPNERLSRRD